LKNGETSDQNEKEEEEDNDEPLKKIQRTSGFQSQPHFILISNIQFIIFYNSISSIHLYFYILFIIIIFVDVGEQRTLFVPHLPSSLSQQSTLSITSSLTNLFSNFGNVNQVSVDKNKVFFFNLKKDEKLDAFKRYNRRSLLYLTFYFLSCQKQISLQKFKNRNLPL